MKTPRSLSYSSLTLWEKNPEEFYLRYLADTRPRGCPKSRRWPWAAASTPTSSPPCTPACSAQGSDPQFAFETIFESQVEPQCRDFALHGRPARLRRLQADRGLRRTACRCCNSPSSRRASSSRSMASLPARRSPASRTAASCWTSAWDRSTASWTGKSAATARKYATSPSKGYMLCRDGYQSDKPSRSHGTQHTNFLEFNHRGLTINAGYMEYCNDEYADQLCLYGWLLGEKPGDENVVGMIEEIVAKPASPAPLAAGRQSPRPHQSGPSAEAPGSGRPLLEGHYFRQRLPRPDPRGKRQPPRSAGRHGPEPRQDCRAYDDWFNEVTRPQLKR